MSLTARFTLIPVNFTQQSVLVFFSLNQKLEELRIETVQLQNEIMLNTFCFHVANTSPLGKTKPNFTT